MNINIWVPKPWVAKKDDTMCKNCKHYYQHYVLTSRGYSLTNAGHCVYPRHKAKEAHDTCEHFKRRES